MELECCHILLNVSDLEQARDFYVRKLALPIIEEHPRMVAVRAGGVRFSIFGGGEKRSAEDEAAQAATIMLRTPNLEASMAELAERGVEFDGVVQQAPGFMRYVALTDPDRNELYLAQYLADPLAPPAATS